MKIAEDTTLNNTTCAALEERLRILETQLAQSRQEKEEALEQSTELFRMALGAMHDGLIVQNQKGEIRICNRRAEEILGLSAAQMAGLTSLDPRWRAVHPDGTDWPGETHPASVALRDGTTLRDILMGVHKPDGSLTWLTVNATPQFRNGEAKAHAVVVTFTDVTARRQLEAEQVLVMEEAIERADRDPLTDLLNHRTFHHRLCVESERVQAQGGTLAVLVLDLDNFKFFNDTYGHLVGDEVLCHIADVLRAACRPDDVLARIGGDEFAILLSRAARKEALAWAEMFRKRVHSLVFQPPGEESPLPLRLSIGVALFPDETASYAEAIYMADKRAMQDKGGEMLHSPSEKLRISLREEADGFSMLDALVSAVDNKDRYTRRHSEDVMLLSGMIGREMGLSEDKVRSLEIAALVHDVGKIGIPVRLLRQPGRLSDRDFETMRQHSVLGGVLVSAIPELAHVLGAVRHHHERWDGEGYPDGLAGPTIPLEARIMAVADAFSAMTTDRPYRVGMKTEEALTILEANAGGQFDPECAAAFATAWRTKNERPGRDGRDAKIPRATSRLTAPAYSLRE